jgi:hypothetical protein
MEDGNIESKNITQYPLRLWYEGDFYSDFRVYDNTASPEAHFRFQRYGGTEAIPAAIPSNADMADLRGWAYDGSSLLYATSIQMYTVGTVATNNITGVLHFEVRDTGVGATYTTMTLDGSDQSFHVNEINEYTGSVGVTIEGVKMIDSYVVLPEVTAPAGTPADDKIYFKNNTTTYDLTAGGSSYWDRSSAGVLSPTTSGDDVLIDGHIYLNTHSGDSSGHVDRYIYWGDDGDWDTRLGEGSDDNLLLYVGGASILDIHPTRMYHNVGSTMQADTQTQIQLVRFDDDHRVQFVTFSDTNYNRASVDGFRYGTFTSTYEVSPTDAWIIFFSGHLYDGTSELEVARVGLYGEGTPSTGSASGQIRFYTRETTGSLTEQVRIQPSGLIYMYNLGSDDTEDHVIAIDDATGLLSKRSVASIGGGGYWDRSSAGVLSPTTSGDDVLIDGNIYLDTNVSTSAGHVDRYIYWGDDSDGWDTFIGEYIDDTLVFFAGGSQAFSISSTSMNIFHNLAIYENTFINTNSGGSAGHSAKYIYWGDDGDWDTYIYESADDVLDFVIGGNLIMELTDAGVDILYALYHDAHIFLNTHETDSSGATHVDRYIYWGDTGDWDTYIGEDSDDSLVIYVGSNNTLDIHPTRVYHNQGSTYQSMSVAMRILGSDADANINYLIHSDQTYHEANINAYRYGSYPSAGTDTSPPSSSQILFIRGWVYDGASDLEVARFGIYQNGAVSSGSASGDFAWYTRETTGSLTERMRLDSSGDLFLHYITNDEAETNLLAYDTATGIVTYRSVASLGGGGYWDRTSDGVLSPDTSTDHILLSSNVYFDSQVTISHLSRYIYWGDPTDGWDTYIYESSDDVLDFVAGSATTFQINSTALTLGTGKYISMDEIDIRDGSTKVFYYDFTQSIVRIGENAGNDSITGDDNVLIGYNAGLLIGNGVANVAIGFNTLTTNVSASYCVAIGNYASEKRTVGAYTVAIGHYAGRYADSGYRNTFIGGFAGQGNTGTTPTGSDNTFIGYAAGQVYTTGGNNVGIGRNALNDLLTGGNNTAIGVQALETLQGGNFNTAIGYYAGKSVLSGSYNTAVGYGAVQTNSTQSYNTAVGYGALNKTLSGNNTAIGYNAGNSSLGSSNVLIGAYSGDHIDGSYNVFVGRYAGYGNASSAGSTAAYNVAVGDQALNELGDGQYNLVIGKSAGYDIEDGSYNLLIGNLVDIDTSGQDYVFRLGYDTRYLLEGDLTASSEWVGSSYEARFETIVGYTDNVTIDEGQPRLVKKAQVLYTNTTQTTIITLPAGAVIWDIQVEVVTAFTGTGTDLLDIGVTGTGNRYEDDLDVSSTGWKTLTLSNVPDRMTGSTAITFQYFDQNSDAGAGEAAVYIIYSLH